MDIITLKMDREMVERMDKIIKEHQYGTRTEFIRTTIREKMTQLEKDSLIKQMLSLRSPGKTSDKELRRIRKKAGEEYMREHGLK